MPRRKKIKRIVSTETRKKISAGLKSHHVIRRKRVILENDIDLVLNEVLSKFHDGRQKIIIDENGLWVYGSFIIDNNLGFDFSFYGFITAKTLVHLENIFKTKWVMVENNIITIEKIDREHFNVLVALYKL